MDWKNLEKDQKSFGTVCKIWQKNICGKPVFLEMWRSLFIVNLCCFPLPPVPQSNFPFPKLSHLSPSREDKFQNSFSSSRHIDNSLILYLLLEFKSWLYKSNEFNNQGTKENRAFRSYLFCHLTKTKKTHMFCIKFT